MKTILVATDLSERSDRAVRRAFWMAERDKGTCHVLHVVDDAMPHDMAERIRDEAEKRLARFFAASGGGTEVTTHVVIGDPMAVIPQLARDLKADLVVLGLHRQRPFLDTLRETTMERLVRNVRTPVLLVQEPADHRYLKALFPVSFSSACAAALGAVRDVAPLADLMAFHAVYLPFTGLTGEKPGGPMDRELTGEARAAMARWIEEEGIEGLEVDFYTGALEDVLRDAIDATRPDLIVLGAHRRGRMALSDLGRFAADLIRDPPTDLLLAHP